MCTVTVGQKLKKQENAGHKVPGVNPGKSLSLSWWSVLCFVVVVVVVAVCRRDIPRPMGGHHRNDTAVLRHRLCLLHHERVGQVRRTKSMFKSYLISSQSHRVSRRLHRPHYTTTPALDDTQGFSTDG